MAANGGAVVSSHSIFGVMGRTGRAGERRRLIVSQALLSFATLAFLYVLVRVRTGAPFWPAVGWRPFRGISSCGRDGDALTFFLGFWLAVVLVSGASRYLDNDKTLPMEELFRNRETVVMLMVLGILVAPFIEETLFRGCLYPVIARRFGASTGVVVTGIVFSLRARSSTSCAGRMGPGVCAADGRGHRAHLHPSARRNRGGQLLGACQLQFDFVCGVIFRHGRPATLPYDMSDGLREIAGCAGLEFRNLEMPR